MYKLIILILDEFLKFEQEYSKDLDRDDYSNHPPH